MTLTTRAGPRHPRRLEAPPCHLRVEEALRRADATLAAVDGIAVASGPGLVGSLTVGVSAAKALSLIPGNHRFNLHASYAETGGKTVERNALEQSHFQGWIDWAKEQQLGLDFNPTFFSHPNADDGFTLDSNSRTALAAWGNVEAG